MKCSKCDFENPVSAKFCVECGTKFEIPCPQCGTANLSSFKFCAECGHNLIQPLEAAPKELSFDEKIEKIQKYLPKGLTDKILSQRNRIEGERKQVTVMFCDMVGYTTMVERLGSDKTYMLMDEVYELLIHEVHRYEGTVNEMTGDGILALFGAPVALEDAPQRAIHSGLAIHREIAKYNEKIKKDREGMPSLKMRIGIHTGPVVVGTLGNDLRVEFKAVGDTVNLASRMENLAEPGTTYVTEETFKLTEGFFRFEALGEKIVKGKKESILTYRVLGSGRSRSRFEARAEKGLTSFVGRERELEILSDCYERAKDGRGQALSIVAGAGLGKSRLLYEFKKSLANEEVTFLEGRCLSYGRNSPYLPVIDVLKDNFRIDVDDGREKIQEKVKKGLSQISPRLDETLPYLSELFALENGYEALKALDPETKQRKTFEALRDISLGGSRMRVLVMAFEDLHWIDKTSEESITLLLEHITGARVFLIFTFRPNYIPPWGGKSYYSQINLNRLSNRESIHLIKSALEVEEIEENLAELVLDKADGIPFFVEEFTRSLLESGALKRDGERCVLQANMDAVRIPETLQDLLMARIDRLPDAAKEVLQIGSVIEREFDWTLIKEVTGLPEMELLSRLSHLKEAELVFERGIFPQTTFIFQHAVTQELLYNSLLEDRRKQYHHAVGTSIEKIYPERLEEHSSILAVHFTRGKDPERGFKYHNLAGERAAASYANQEAMEHLKEALHLIDKCGQEPEQKRLRLDTVIKLCEVMEFLGEFETTFDLLEGILKGSDDTEDPERFAKVHYWMGNNFGNMGRYDEARENLFRSLDLTQVSQNKETEGRAHNYLSQLDLAQGYLERGLDHAEAAVQCSLGIENPVRIAWAFLFKMAIISDLKEIPSWLEVLNETKIWVERSKSDRARALFHFLHSVGLYRMGDYEASLKTALEGLNLAEKIGESIQTVFIASLGGVCALYLGKSKFALELLRNGEEKGKELGHPWALAYLRVSMAEALLRLGKIEESKTPAEAALNFCQKLDLGITLMSALHLNAEILSNQLPMEEKCIDDMMKKAEALVERSNSPLYKIRHLMAIARISVKRKNITLAKESFSLARAIYKKIGLEDGTPEFLSLEKEINL